VAKHVLRITRSNLLLQQLFKRGMQAIVSLFFLLIIRPLLIMKNRVLARAMIREVNSTTFSEVKEKLGDEYSYSDIQFAFVSLGDAEK